MTTIVTALISAGATLAVCLINNHYQRKRDKAALRAEKQKEQKNIDEHLTEHLQEIINAQNESTRLLHNEIELIKYKISELTKHVDKHNNVIERTYNLEMRTELQEEKINVANKRIADLERKDDKR